MGRVIVTDGEGNKYTKEEWLEKEDAKEARGELKNQNYVPLYSRPLKGKPKQRARSSPVYQYNKEEIKMENRERRMEDMQAKRSRQIQAETILSRAVALCLFYTDEPVHSRFVKSLIKKYWRVGNVEATNIAALVSRQRHRFRSLLHVEGGGRNIKSAPYDLSLLGKSLDEIEDIASGRQKKNKPAGPWLEPGQEETRPETAVLQAIQISSEDELEGLEAYLKYNLKLGNDISIIIKQGEQ